MTQTTDRQQLIISRRGFWLSVIVAALSIVFSFASVVYYSTRAYGRIENTEVRVERVEKRLDVHEQHEYETTRTLQEIAINLKTLMERQGIKYQEGTK